MCSNGPGCIIDSASNASFVEVDSIKYYSDRFYLNEPTPITNKRLNHALPCKTGKQITEPWSAFDRNKLVESLYLSCAIISTYSINWNWIEKEIPSLFGDGAELPVLLLHHDRKSNARQDDAKQVPEDEEWDSENSTKAESKSNVSIVRVRSSNSDISPPHFGVHHPKYMILFEKSGSVVIVINTCNLTKPYSFEGFWIQRFEKSNRSLKYREGMNDFGWILADFLQVQTDFATKDQNETSVMPFTFLKRHVGISSASELSCAFQFDKANVFLVSTVPGSHVGPQSAKKYYRHDSSVPPVHYGPQRISYIMQNFLSPFSSNCCDKLTPLPPRQAKRLKIKHRKPYLPSILLSPNDRIIIQGTTYGPSWNQKNMLPVLQSYLANNDGQRMSLKNLSIIWPSMSYMQSCNKVLGQDGTIAFLTSENFNTIELAILSRMVLYRPVPLFPWQMEKSQDIPISPHIKSVSRIIQKNVVVPINSDHISDTTFLSYFLLSSSNFSQGAQGKHIPSEYDTMGYANFELGVLFPSRIQGNPFQDRLYASTSIHNLQNNNRCLHCHSYCKILPLNKKVKVIYLPIPFQLENCSNVNNYMKEDDDTDLMYTPFFSEIRKGTEAVGNMRLTPYGKDWIKSNFREIIPDSKFTSYIPPFIIMLCGIPGSGKTKFAEMLTSANSTRFERISQDVLGTRKKCETACKEAINNKKVAVIDRCNFDVNQRQHFMNIAAQCGIAVDCIVFQYDTKECMIRCIERGNHETVDHNNAKRVVSLVANQFHAPDEEESKNFRTLHLVTSFRQAEIIASDYTM